MSLSARKAAQAVPELSLQRPTGLASIFAVEDRESILIRAGTVVISPDFNRAFDDDTPVGLPELVAGTDYRVFVDGSGQPVAVPYDIDGPAGVEIGGFHFAPGGNATARSGGDTIPAINPHSCWDIGYRPACPDPRGMALVTADARGNPIRPFWADIYLLNADHIANGTSRAGADIADHWSPPVKCDGSGRYRDLNGKTAAEILAHHGKQPLSDEEFRAAAFGTTEKKSRGKEPDRTGLESPDHDAPFTSLWGLFQATGCMWVHGTDGDPDPAFARFTILGGNWTHGSSAGWRAAAWHNRPWSSNDDIGARGRSDHLSPA